MYKHIFIIFFLISLGDCTLGDTYFSNELGHTDNIYGIYNASSQNNYSGCIETVNYLFLFYNSPDNETIKEDVDIWLENISQIGDKAFKADLYYLD